MTKKFSTSWNASKRPRKQRNYRRNAPLHTKKKFLGAHLSKELRLKHNTRSVTVVVGDKVKILRGQFKGRENKVEKIDIKQSKVFITGVDSTKKDGSKAQYPFTPSNIMITELNLEDKKRKEMLARKTADGKVEKPKQKQVKPAPKTTEKPETKTVESKQETTKAPTNDGGEK